MILAGCDPAGRRVPAGDTITIERTGTNEETTTVIEVGVDPTSGPYMLAWVTKSHTSDVFIDRETQRHATSRRSSRTIINTSGDTVAGRFGPD